MGKFKRLLKRKQQLSKTTDEQNGLQLPETHQVFKTSGQIANDVAIRNKSDSETSLEKGSRSKAKENRSLSGSSGCNKSKNQRLFFQSGSFSEIQQKSARATGNIATGVVAGSGTQILWYFISTLGTKSEKSLSRSWLPSGATISQEKAWTYEVRQGQGNMEMNIVRSQMNGRLYRTGNRLQGGGWSRLLLGDEFTAIPSKRQSHKLKFVVSYCVCITCRINSMKNEQEFHDMDRMLEDAEQGIGFEEEVAFIGRDAAISGLENNRVNMLDKNSKPKITDPRHACEMLIQYTELPPGNDLGLLGETLDSQEFELGTVSKISAKNAKVSFSRQAKKFFHMDRYVGLLSQTDISTIVSEKAKEHFRIHKGKTVRRFYLCGALHKMLLEGISAVLCKPSRKCSDDERRKQSIGVLFRRQIMSVFIGNLALEESFGSFIDTKKSMYLGFGHDEHGAQSIYSNGRLGDARRLGINELRSHLCAKDGQSLVLEMF